MLKRMLVSMSLASLLTLAGCAGGVGTSPKGLEAPIEKASIRLVADVREGGYTLVGADELNKWVTEKKPMIVIDTMPRENFVAGHITGAVNSPMPKTDKELTPYDKESLLAAAGADKNATIVAYCGFVACRRSHWAAKILVENGYTNVLRYPGGWIGWCELGYPVSK
jgi:rhodanese-related sulfurtransferase